MDLSANRLHALLAHLSSVGWMLHGAGAEIRDGFVRRRRPLRFSHLLNQADRVGVGSLPLVALVSFFIGLTMALLTGHQLRSFGQEELVPALVSISFTRELGPLMTGIVLAARIGAAFTAELGTMTVNEEVEALEAMGLGALRLLVAPRVLAVVLLMPSLVVVSDLSALLGATTISHWAFGMNHRFFFENALESLILRDLVSGVLKSLLFGLIVGAEACFQGLTVRGGAAGVGGATTASVVAAITSVIACDSLFNIILVAIPE
jgi:phospholipid/cholesterol/gamma-HCH transport system permease protein